MPVKGAGASFKLASATYVMTEVAQWLSDITGDASTDETSISLFSPGASAPLKTTVYGATDRGHTLTGQWSAAVETFFNALDGATEVAYEYSPEGTAIGKTRIYGSCNLGAWSGPQQSASGTITFSVSIKLNSRKVETIVTPPSTVAITSSSVASPTVITSAAHSLTTGEVITIAGHTGSTPSLNGTFPVTVIDTTHFTIPVTVTVGGTGGTIQN